ncbi:hypothetical protein ACWEDZ_38415 [Streptomyces sp. NPDC005047]
MKSARELPFLVMNLQLGDRPEHVHAAWREFFGRTESGPVPECTQTLDEPLYYNRQEIDGNTSILRPNLLCDLWWSLGPYYEETNLPKVVLATIVTQKGIQSA